MIEVSYKLSSYLRVQGDRNCGIGQGRCSGYMGGRMESFALDKAFPFSATWAKVNHCLGVQLNAHIACNVIVVLLGTLYTASADWSRPLLSC